MINQNNIPKAGTEFIFNNKLEIKINLNGNGCKPFKI